MVVHTLWAYQWLRRPGDLSEEMMNVIHDQTQGVRAFMVDMFLIAQLHALRAGEETMTPELFKHVARTEFAPVQPVLRALRSKDPSRLAKFEDACAYDMEEMLDRIQAGMTASSLAGAAESTSRPSYVTSASANVSKACGLGLGEARALVVRALSSRTPTSAAALTEAAIKLLYESPGGEYASTDSPRNA